MITEQERIIRESQGFNLGFEYNGKKYWVNTNDWNDAKEKRFRQETGLNIFREETIDQKLVLYNPEFFEVLSTKMGKVHYLHYKGGLTINIPQPLNMSSGYRMFADRSDLGELNLRDWDTSLVKDISHMFTGCSGLTSLLIENWDVSNVKYAQHTFDLCTRLATLNIENWDVSNVVKMQYMFWGCSSITSLNLRDWNTCNVEDFQHMFNNCESLKSLELKDWDISKARRMNHMFFKCTSLETLSLPYIDTIRVFDKKDMFWWCKTLYDKYGTDDERKLLHKIIEVSGNAPKC